VVWSLERGVGSDFSPHSQLHTLSSTLLLQQRDLLLDIRNLRFHLRVGQLMLGTFPFALRTLNFAPGVDLDFRHFCHGFDFRFWSDVLVWGVGSFSQRVECGVRILSPNS